MALTPTSIHACEPWITRRLFQLLQAPGVQHHHVATWMVRWFHEGHGKKSRNKTGHRNTAPPVLGLCSTLETSWAKLKWSKCRFLWWVFCIKCLNVESFLCLDAGVHWFARKFLSLSISLQPWNSKIWLPPQVLLEWQPQTGQCPVVTGVFFGHPSRCPSTKQKYQECLLMADSEKDGEKIQRHQRRRHQRRHAAIHCSITTASSLS